MQVPVHASTNTLKWVNLASEMDCRASRRCACASDEEEFLTPRTFMFGGHPFAMSSTCCSFRPSERMRTLSFWICVWQHPHSTTGAMNCAWSIGEATLPSVWSRSVQNCPDTVLSHRSTPPLLLCQTELFWAMDCLPCSIVVFIPHLFLHLCTIFTATVTFVACPCTRWQTLPSTQ